MPQVSAPSVFIQEIDAFPNSVVQVSTANAAFVGSTEKADAQGDDMTGKVVEVTSMAQYVDIFGNAAKPEFSLVKAKDPEEAPPNPFGSNGEGHRDPFAMAEIVLDSGKSATTFYLRRRDPGYLMYDALDMFFASGGIVAKVVSTGRFAASIEVAPLSAGLETLSTDEQVNLVVLPDAVRLARKQCADLQRTALAQCSDRKDRFAILDIFGGHRERSDPMGDPIDAFRTDIGTSSLKYGAAYYPWLNTSLTQIVTYQSIAKEDRATLVDMIASGPADAQPPKDLITKMMADKGSDTPTTNAIHEALLQASPVYRQVVNHMLEAVNLVPPSGALAGLYSMTDELDGVWKAPANVQISLATGVSTSINDEAQADLNVDHIGGKSINAIRKFARMGILVWGARTLDGNSQDWRYIPVCRTVIFIEQSIKNAMRNVVFEPNDANTWASVKAMINNFLDSIWNAGGLHGSTPEQAFGVDVGLGSTMTANDVANGVMNVTVRVALSHPAEFIVLTMQQQMATTAPNEGAG